jgi:hypothetical protein
MVSIVQHDKFEGYEQFAEAFIRARNQRIGGVAVRQETAGPGW